ncbi:hypothetical protein QQF64_014592 [Cirrhinus molitorella]|uniref:Uncharacterized protein n=1 Tax=Cirrhinus molitorella TaxID=172907 RepID=A0ABR3NSI3_9TELE
MNEDSVEVNAASVCHIDVCGYGPAAGEYPLTLGGGGVYVGEVGFNDIAVDALAICSEPSESPNANKA